LELEQTNAASEEQQKQLLSTISDLEQQIIDISITIEEST
jgi:hypothetical protein